MSEYPEDIMKAANDLADKHYVDKESVVREIISAAILAERERCFIEPAGAVKPLRWRKGYCDERVTINQASNGWLYQVRVLDGVIWLDWPDREATQFPSEELAREAAFADYSARIMSAIEHDRSHDVPTTEGSNDA